PPPRPPPFPYTTLFRSPGATPRNERPGDYLAFLGRISPEKRVDRAVEIARRLGMKLRVAAKVDGADVDYFRAQIEPLFREPFVEDRKSTRLNSSHRTIS